MPVLTLTAPEVALTSSWYYRYDPDERVYIYGTPSTMNASRFFDLAVLPEGAEITEAVLTTSRWGSGRRMINGWDGAGITIDPASIDRDEGITVRFSYQSYGGYRNNDSSTSGTASAQAGWTNITLAITYEMPYTAPTAPTAVTLSKAMATPGESVTLSWSGAKAGNNVNISGYQVYRAAAADGEYILLMETAAEILQASVYAPESAGSYFYKVKALGDVSGYDSGLSDAYAQVSVSVTAPSAPSDISLSRDKQYPGGEATLSFSGAQAGENNPIRGYALWMADRQDGPFEQIDTLVSTAESGAFTVYAPDSGSRYYKVQTLGQYMDGPLSNAAVITADLSGTSDFSLSEDTVDAGTALTITLLSNTDKAHTLIASIGEYSETIQSAAGAGSLSFTPPLSWLSAMPDSETWPMLISIRTAGAGTIRKKVMLRCPNDVGPTVSGAYALRIDNDVPSGWGVYVQGKSQAEIHLEQEAQAAYGSPIVSYRMEGAGGTAESAAVPFSMLTGLLPAGNVNITVTATDARGRKGTQQIAIAVEAYQAPALKNIVTLRCDAAGNEHDEGSHARLDADLIYSSCGGHNSAAVWAAYRMQGAEGWTEAGSPENGLLIFGGGNLDSGRNYDVQYRIADSLGGEAIYYDVITRAKPELHIRRGGGAWAFGGLADTEGALKVYGDLALTGGMRMGAENAGMLMYVNESGLAVPLALGKGMYIAEGVLQLGTAPGAEETLADLAIGTEVYLMEASLQPYIVIARDHHGVGLVTLIRKYAASSTSTFRYTAPSGAAGNKYDGSTLQSVHATYYQNLPEDTRAKIQEVSIPVHNTAYTTSDVVAVAAHVFPLSEIEYTGSGAAEGSHIAYFDSTGKRIAYAEDGETARATWTRSVTLGQTSYARRINTSGDPASNSVTAAGYLRPACCVKSDIVLFKDDEDRYIL